MASIKVWLSLLIASELLNSCTAYSLFIDRRSALKQVALVAGTGGSVSLNPWKAGASDAATDRTFAYEDRDRNNNKNALIRDDFYFLFGKTPPRLLKVGQLPAEDPTYNAWGLCSTSSTTGNSCTYVPLKQRYEGYKKYAATIRLGLLEYATIPKILDDCSTDESQWASLAQLLNSGSKGAPPASPVDALLKSVLLGNALLVSPNFGQLQREVLVMRFYANEAAFATSELREAIYAKDLERAKAAWAFGRDSWNSYVVVVNRAINEKVGDPFPYVET